MNILSVLCDDFMELPLENSDKEINFKSFISSKFDEYKILLNQINDIDIKDIRSKSSELIEAIENSIDLYYNGLSHEAYMMFKKGINYINEYLKIISTDANFEFRKNYYRARVDNNKIEYKLNDKTDMFHIPFNKRYLVKNQRYSIAGFPCLYLGATPYTCWEELGRPRTNEFVVSRIRFLEDIELLNIGMIPYHLKDIINKKTIKRCELDIVEENREILVAYLICIPLILACSVRSSSKNVNFKEEYIIPQMLTQWIKDENQFDGIRYFSTRTYTYSKINYNLYQNIIIPTKSSNDTGYCKRLKEKILITEPVYANEVLEKFKGSIRQFFKKNQELNNETRSLLEEYEGINYTIIKEKNNGRIVQSEISEIHYSSSGFSVLEEKLYSINASKIE
ncbi:hypothetical protein [Paraclostridium sordellii]|uniref:hypothetical protein n=1 Tax=Paraclostridium sordellii TaxID=1505 RepID=UPI0005E79517|nr:hypothetical protein [Paeniclostridium sordellii]CEQ26144.1 Uncharacterised protein [[Clostridium] sordellii] [Paeniclostridium sordellii]